MAEHQLDGANVHTVGQKAAGSLVTKTMPVENRRQPSLRVERNPPILPIVRGPPRNRDLMLFPVHATILDAQHLILPAETARDSGVGSVLVLDGRVCSVGEQQFEDGGIGVAGCQEQRRQASRAGAAVRVGAAIKTKPDGGTLPLEDRVLQRRRVPVVSRLVPMRSFRRDLEMIAPVL